jgi:formamidopyrimidine-DNA glycosylase
VGRSIVGAEIISGRYSKKEPDGWSLLVGSLPITVKSTDCKGKFIYTELAGEKFFLSTLGMTGSWSSRETKHSRLRLRLDDGGTVYFNDIRNFGTVKIVESRSLLDKKLSELGPDMLSGDVSDDVFIRSIRRYNKTLAEVLMDQKIICGVGNYLKAECLYFSKLSPHRLTSSLTDEDLKNLNSVIKKVIKTSYETGGATIYTFSNYDGEKGDYTKRFAVYNQAQDPLGHEVKRETTRDGRTTFWVPTIQN